MPGMGAARASGRVDRRGAASAVALSCGALMMGAYATLSIAPIGPLVRDDLGISLAAFGLITTAIFGGAAVASTPSGHLTDRIGAVRLLAFAMVAVAVAEAVAALTEAQPEAVEHLVTAAHEVVLAVKTVVDATEAALAQQRADLAVAIRTFTVAEGHTTFGTGAGITVGSDPKAEWVETELKAARLLAALPALRIVGLARAYENAVATRTASAEFFDEGGRLLGPGLTAEEAALAS